MNINTTPDAISRHRRRHAGRYVRPRQLMMVDAQGIEPWTSPV
jgi:hypothetical protein